MPQQPAPTVSVVIPAYDVTAYIHDALESVFAQRFTDYEVIVVNDGCPDTPNLERALAPYRDRIRYLQQENRGLAGARNAGLHAARGRLVSPLDADDLWEADYLATHVSMFEADPALDVAFSNALIVGDVPEAGMDCMSLAPPPGPITFERVVGQECYVIGFATIRRETLLAAGGWDASLRSSEDFELWVRLLHRGGRFARCERVLATYRKRAGSLSSDPVRMLDSALRAMDRIARYDLTPAQRAVVEVQRSRFAAGRHYEQARLALRGGDIRGAIAGFEAANALEPARGTAALIALLRIAPRLLMAGYRMRRWYLQRRLRTKVAAG
jgi:hypothetical protein